MKLLEGVLLILILVFVSLVVVAVFMGSMYQVYSIVKSVAESLGVNSTSVDLITPLQPALILLNIALIIGLLFAIYGVFSHSRER